MTTKENERLLGFLDKAEAVLDEALPFFRRIDECNAFGIGGSPGSLTRKDPDVVAIRDRIESFVGPLAEQLIKATDKHGRPLDFPGPIRDADGNLQTIGARGERLCALWLEFRSALGSHDARGSVGVLDIMRAFLAELRSDISLAVCHGEPLAPKLSRKAARVWNYVKDRDALPTYDEITAELQMGRKTVSDAFKELRAKGYVSGTEIEPK